MLRQLPMLVFLMAAAAANAAADPYDFRGAKLGMTLSEFKAMPFPDPDSRTLGSYANEATLVCTGDQVSHGYDPVAVGREDAAAGAITCAWMLPPNQAHYRHSWERAYIEVGEYSSLDVDYRFAPLAPGEPPLLRQVAITLSTKAFGKIVEGLRGRFGEPADTVNGEVKNGLGNTFSSSTVQWKNPVSSLTVIERVGKIDQMGMVYTHTATDAAFKGRIETAKGPPKL